MQRLHIVEEDVQRKLKQEEETQRLELMKHKFLAERREAVQIELDYMAKKQALAAEDLQRKKEEHDEYIRQKTEKHDEYIRQKTESDLALRKQQLAMEKEEMQFKQIQDAEHERKLHNISK